MKAKATRFLKWFGRNLVLTICTVTIFLFALELTYRYYWFDFYSTEITLLNVETINKQHSKTILVLGDSFTASTDSYVKILNDSISEIRFINAGAPGFGIQEINTIAAHRIEEFKPDAIILQLYVGNDLIDMKRPINWGTVSFPRNLYWTIANHFLSIRYLNYKLGQFKSNTGLATERNNIKNDNEFSLERFSTREKILIAADPSYLSNSISVSEMYDERFNAFKSQLQEVVDLCAENKIPLTIVVIPSACQISEQYANRYIACGAILNKESIVDTNYAFFYELNTSFDNKTTHVLSPLSDFQNADSTGFPLYYTNDIHLNALGQQQLALYLMRELFPDRRWSNTSFGN